MGPNGDCIRTHTFLKVVLVIICFLFCYVLSSITYFNKSYSNGDVKKLEQERFFQKTSDDCYKRRMKSDHFQNATLYGYPKIIHRIYGLWDDAKDMSAAWRYNCYNSCQEEENGFERIVWNKSKINTFLTTYYPWFLKTFHDYPYNVQRADVARYFILHHYGGLYLDMDRMCSNNITQFYKLVSRKPGRKILHEFTNVVLLQTFPRPSVTNNVMLSKRCDPFMMYLISHLEEYNTWYVSPYFTVMFTTGPSYVTNMLQQFRSFKNVPFTKQNQTPIAGNKHLVYDITQETLSAYIRDGGKHGTWHSWDAVFILGAYSLVRTTTACLITVLVSFVLITAVCVFICARCKANNTRDNDCS